MRRAVIVIGCSYGDEGKGLASYWAASGMGAPCLNVMINGGAQRGHTVDLKDGRRHVFHHFGSGSLSGADTCADTDYIVNPAVFVREAVDLKDTFGFVPKEYVSRACRVSTPYDMMAGQIIEEFRGTKRHGSCGLGIQETRLRYLDTDWALPYGALETMGEEDFRRYCRRIVFEYLPSRLMDFGMSADEKWQAALRDEGLIASAYRDLDAMRRAVTGYDSWEELAAGYPALVFEAGQGLALDALNEKDFPYLTPSRTTSLVSARRIAALPGPTDAHILYVTRSYLTRHGAGPLPGECPKDLIGPDIVDRTNVPNPHQQVLRYAPFDLNAVKERVSADLAETRKVLPDAGTAMLVTHLNETGGVLSGGADIKALSSFFDRTYCSFDPFDVKESETGV